VLRALRQKMPQQTRVENHPGAVALVIRLAVVPDAQRNQSVKPAVFVDGRE